MGDKNSLPDTVREITRGEGVSTVIELTGNPDVASLSLNLLKVSGKLVLVAYGAGSSFHVNTLMMVSREIDRVITGMQQINRNVAVLEQFSIL